ncbi:MAG: hypothetical protein PWP68_1757 [Rikenellaceae bacterium]|nr:hypothetical protein [Rikenellaceae bacterium]MDK2946823.1 hypothetical protein [Geotoga sp.]
MVNKTHKDWKENIFLSKIELKKIDARYFDNLELDKTEVKLQRKPNLEIIKQGRDVLKVKLIDHIFFKPEGPFEILIEYLGNFRSSMEIPKEISDKDLKEIGFPLSTYSLSLVSNITERFGMIPLILPPWSGLREESK